MTTVTTVTTKPNHHGPGAEMTLQLNQSHGAYELVLSPVILALLGFWADRSLGTGPWLMVSAALIGFVGAVVKIYYSYRSKMAAHAAHTSAAARERAT